MGLLPWSEHSTQLHCGDKLIRGRIPHDRHAHQILLNTVMDVPTLQCWLHTLFQRGLGEACSVPGALRSIITHMYCCTWIVNNNLTCLLSWKWGWGVLSHTLTRLTTDLERLPQTGGDWYSTDIRSRKYHLQINFKGFEVVFLPHLSLTFMDVINYT